MPALLRRAVGWALVLGRRCAIAAGVTVRLVMLATGTGILVVASGDAAGAAVAHVRRRRVVAVDVAAVGEFWLVLSSTVAWGIAVRRPLAVVGVRHAKGAVQLG